MAAIRSSTGLLALALAGCGAEPEPVAYSPPAYCEERRFEGSRFSACRYDPERHELALILDDEEGPLRNFANLASHLGEQAERLAFAMNAGMYDAAGMPIGLYVEDGEERKPINLRDGRGNFHMKPNGVFWVDGDGRAAVSPSERFAAERPRARWATQSGPMLLIDGEPHPRFEPDGESRNIRNGVCSAEGGGAWFAISEEPVSFGRFARFFRDGLGCGDDALYLDGRVSSLWDRPAHRRDAFPSLGPLVAVFEKER